VAIAASFAKDPHGLRKIADFIDQAEVPAKQQYSNRHNLEAILFWYFHYANASSNSIAPLANALQKLP
jgi:hypothetical protein